MRQFIALGLCVLSAGLMADKGFAQGLPDRRVGFTFLLLPNGARDEALGATGVASVGSASTMVYNPAGLAFVERIDATYTYVDWYGRTKKHVACIAGRVSKAGTFGLSLQNFDAGRTTIYDNRSSTTLDVKNYAVTGAWGAEMNDRFALGTAVKLIREGYGDGTWNAFALDLGAYFATESRNAMIALGARNLSTGAMGEPERIAVPKQVRAGVLIDLISTMGFEPFPYRLDIAVDLTRPFYPHGQSALHTGVEYTHITSLAPGYSLAISLRAGQKSRTPIALGFGFDFTTAGGSGIAVDYANRGFGGSVRDQRIHVFSVALYL